MKCTVEKTENRRGAAEDTERANTFPPPSQTLEPRKVRVESRRTRWNKGIGLSLSLFKILCFLGAIFIVETRMGEN